MRDFARDVVLALRSWRRTPGMLAAAVLALALGIGANTTIWSVVHGVLLRPLGFAHPERLVMVWQDMRARGGREHELLSPGLIVEWTRRATVFESLGAVGVWSPNLTGQDEPERLRGAAVSAGYFAALGVPAALGRVFDPAEDVSGGPAVAVLSDRLWRRRFGGDPAILGRTVLLDGRSTTVLGVMPASFDAPIIPADLWSPLRLDPARAPRGMIMLRALARLRPGVPLDAARAEMRRVAQQLGGEDAEWERAGVAMVPLVEEIVGPVRPVLLLFVGVVALVLLIACANVASLLLVRATARARELAVRAALGAGRGRVLRQLAAESLVLAVLGGLGGLLLAFWGVHALVAAAPAGMPRLGEVRIDGSVLAFTAAVTLLTALVAGFAPALAGSKIELNAALRGESGGVSVGHGRARAGLVVLEVALATVLAIGAGLLVRSLIALQRVDLGFDAGHVLTASVAPPATAYRDGAAQRQLYARLLEKAAALPGVESAALTSVLPLSGMNTNLRFGIPGRPLPANGDEPVAWFRLVTPDYFRVLGIPVLAGRGFVAGDRDGAPVVAVVNASLAKRTWPTESAVGQRLDVEGQEATVVGVVADVHHEGPAAPPQAELYLPIEQSLFGPRGVWLVLRTAGAPEAMLTPLRAAVRAIDPNLPLAAAVPLGELVGRSVARQRFFAWLLTGFSFLAAILALVGVYGVVAYAVGRRQREIGVRMALGATRGAVLALFLGRSMVLVGAGIAAGIGLALLCGRLLRSLLFAVQPGDPWTLATLAAAVALAGLAASYHPACRAARVDPMSALRDE